MNDIIKKAEDRMDKSIDSLVSEYAAVRAGRANPKILDKVNVDYYGTPTPVAQLATVSVPEARILLIQPWDKSVLKEIEKAINVAELGINPQNDGECIRLNFPPLTEERRKDLVRDISKYGEDCKIAVRAIRRDAMDELKALKKKSEYSEDQIKAEEKKVQDLTDRFCDKVDKLSGEKEKEIMDI